MGLLMNAEKKNSASKKSGKAHALSQGQQDLSFVKALLVDKTNSNSMTKAINPQLGGFGQSATGTNFSQPNIQ